MKYCKIGETEASRVIMGCMRIADKPLVDVERVISTALSKGVNAFDHADIYGKGDCETIFGVAIKDLGVQREDVVLQSKCGIRKGFYDFSKEHIVETVESSLRRLNTEYLDILLLHRPDALMETEEVCEAFNKLQNEGKVLSFGVSNFSPLQIQLLTSAGVQIVANQVQFSLGNTILVDEGLNVNMQKQESVQRGGDLLNYCRLHNVTLQAWSPLIKGFFEDSILNAEAFPVLNEKLAQLAEKYGCTPSAIALAWILRHPAKMQVITGTTDAERMSQICACADIELTRQEWYELYLSTGKTLP